MDSHKTTNIVVSDMYHTINITPLNSDWLSRMPFHFSIKYGNFKRPIRNVPNFNFRNKVSIVLFHVIKGMVPVLACYIKLWICTWNVRRALNLKLRLHTAINLADFLSW